MRDLKVDFETIRSDVASRMNDDERDRRLLAEAKGIDEFSLAGRLAKALARRVPEDTGEFMFRMRLRAEEMAGVAIAQRERILEAFIAETGCQPSECEAIEWMTEDGSRRFWVQKRNKEAR